MLQTIHEESNTPRASSLYCVWIPSPQEAGPSLIALWIDDDMRVFEQDFVPEDSAGHHEVGNGRIR
jgi:hypothetical protein